MRVALVGLATTHPFTDAQVLHGLGCDVAVAVDAPDTAPSGLATLRERGCVQTTVDAVRRGWADLAIVTVRPGRVPRLVASMVAAGVPTFANKPVAAHHDDVAALDATLDSNPAPFFSCSVLRFAPAVVALAQDVRADSVISASARVQHDIAAFAAPERRWQDDPLHGGGHLVALGLHGIEMLAHILGPPAPPLYAAVARRVHTWSRSEDVAALAGTFGSVPCVISFEGAAPGPRYHVSLATTEGDREVTLTGDAPRPTVALGYRGTMEAALLMARTGSSPVPWSHTRRLLTVTLRAASDARARLSNS